FDHLTEQPESGRSGQVGCFGDVIEQQALGAMREDVQYLRQTLDHPGARSPTATVRCVRRAGQVDGHRRHDASASVPVGSTNPSICLVVWLLGNSWAVDPACRPSWTAGSITAMSTVAPARALVEPDATRARSHATQDASGDG